MYFSVTVWCTSLCDAAFLSGTLLSAGHLNLVIIHNLELNFLCQVFQWSENWSNVDWYNADQSFKPCGTWSIWSLCASQKPFSRWDLATMQRESHECPNQHCQYDVDKLQGFTAGRRVPSRQHHMTEGHEGTYADNGYQRALPPKWKSTLKS